MSKPLLCEWCEWEIFGKGEGVAWEWFGEQDPTPLCKTHFRIAEHNVEAAIRDLSGGNHERR